MTSHQHPQESLAHMAEQVVQRMEQCMAHIRTTPAFAAPTNKKSPFEYPLYSSMTKMGLVKDIQETCQCALELTGAQSILNQDDGAAEEAAMSERSLVVHYVLLPLLEALWRCYQVLDDPANDIADGTVPQVLEEPSTAKPKRTQAPPPPPGLLLSLRNYTDIACALELTVASSILPLVDDHVLCPPRLYARTLANAVKGRIPAKSLVWWMTAANATDGEVEQEHVDTERGTLELKLTTILLARVVLLDRFRPMLLPRHLVHVFAAALQVQHECTLRMQQQEQNQLDGMDTWQLSLGMLGLKDHDACDTLTATLVDPLLVARTYQTLLAQGMAAPLWLRQIVGSRLSNMPLRILLQVFAGDSAAAMRLARAVVSGTGVLVASSSSAAATTRNSNEEKSSKVASICRQVVELLDEIGSNHVQEDGLGKEQTFLLETLWAILDLLVPKFIDTVIKSLCAVDSYEVRIQRFGALVMHVPPFVDNTKIALLIFRRMADQSLSVFDLALRISAMPTMLHSDIKQTAHAILGMMLRALLLGGLPKKAQATTLDAVVVALISSCIGDWDMARNELYIEFDEKDVLSEHVRCRYTEGEVSIANLVQGAEERSKVLADILGVLLAEDKEGNREKVARLVSDLFLALVAMYFECSSTIKEKRHLDTPSFLTRGSFKLVPMVLLPILVESLPLDSLLFGGTNLFQMMRIVFESTARQCGGRRQVEASETNHGLWHEIREKMAEAADLFVKMSSLPKLATVDPGNLFMDADDTDTISISSILLSMLVGMLELGASRRSEDEEQLIQSLQVALGTLADVHADESSSPTADIPSEIAELASHALALVVARQTSTKDSISDGQLSDHDLNGTIARLERDLQYSEPPIRARAVVKLRHMAAICLQTLEDGSSENDFNAKFSSDAFWQCLRLCVTALADSESFVYLAAIQTIASMANATFEVARAVSLGVAVGFFYCGSGTSMELSSEQRMKLTESMISAVKRKAVVDDNMTQLIDILIDKTAAAVDSSEFLPVGAVGLIQSETHEYFVGRKNQNDYPRLIQEEWGAMDTRLKTGGPMFDAEEADSVSSGKIVLVAELISKMHPAAVARYCNVLARCAIDIIRLEDKRILRRSGALLARELYSTLFREYAAAAGYAFAIQFVNGREEELATALVQCMGDDSLSHNDDRQRFSDPATVARCKEALALRSEAQEEGILIAARTAAESMKRDNDLSVLLEPSQSRRDAALPIMEVRSKLIEEIE